jgi:hypothetical protein
MIGCAFDTTVIKVEAVNIDVCFHKPLNTETAVRRSRTRFAEATTGGYASIIAKNGETVKQTLFLFYLKCLDKPFSQAAKSGLSEIKSRGSDTALYAESTIG